MGKQIDEGGGTNRAHFAVIGGSKMASSERANAAKTQEKPTRTAANPVRVVAAAMLIAVAATVGVSQSPPPSGSTSAAGNGLAGIADMDALARVGAAGDMIGFSHSDGSGTQTITIVHAEKSWMAVYHIDRSGKIRLVSSRPIDADFSLQLNATSPLPEEIREIGRR